VGLAWAESVVDEIVKGRKVSPKRFLAQHLRNHMVNAERTRGTVLWGLTRRNAALRAALEAAGVALFATGGEMISLAAAKALRTKPWRREGGFSEGRVMRTQATRQTNMSGNTGYVVWSGSL